MSQVNLFSFVSAEISRDKSQMHSIRMALVTQALDVAYRGNKSQYLQAMTYVTSAKGKLAKAYRAGFSAAPTPDKFAYTGKLTAEVAAKISEAAKAQAAKFHAAFVEVFPLTEAEQSEEEKAKAEAEKQAKADKKAIARAEELGYSKPRELGASELSDMMVQAIKSGQLTGENLARVAQAANEAIKADTEAARIIKAARKSDKATS
jgi:hypothetical protein